MKQGWSGRWFRMFALCLAIGLGAAFVWSQQKKATPAKAGAVLETKNSLSADGNRVAGEAPLMPGSKSTTSIIVLDQQKPKDPSLLPDWKQTGNPDRTLMHSSKSAIIVEPKNRVLMPGSKSLVIPPPNLPKAEP